MNRLEVQEIYDKVSTPRTISAIEALGLKSCLFYDLFGTYSVENISDTDVYIQVKSKIESLCKYALDNEHEPVAKDYNGDDICIGGTVWYDNEKYLVHTYRRDDDLERLLCTCCDAWETPQWLYIDSDVTVRNPNAQSSDIQAVRDALKALQDTLQKDVCSKLETALERLKRTKKRPKTE